MHPGLLPSRKKARIEMLPLIDIVFLLLVFFIYAMLSMAVHRGLPVVLPVSSTAEIDTDLTLSLTVKQDGSAYLDKESINIENLQVVLQDRMKAMDDSEAADTRVLLFADQSLSYQDLYKVLDQIKMAGIANISLQADGAQ
ncbi:MAG: biopolymer transporter ExbD [Proteobacteria bacterium]|nr:biopolymer transporter ExbD [Pseudomonadota bacterium]